ncbi:MAG: aquaporin [Trueperaceae bacterium]|nr:aquaporin [Trueperaceae bacterium]
MNLKVWLAEFIGTFALLFAGIAAIAAGATELAISLAFGLTVAVMISAVGALSFAHFNPAVTLGFFMMRRIGFKELLLYWSAELLGACFALLSLKVVLGAKMLDSVAYGATLPSSELSVLQGLGIEVVLSFFLMFVIATCVIQKQPQAGLYIGFTVTLCALAGGVFTGASMNPARSFAPALFSGMWSHHWLYWLGPALGSSLASITARYLWQEA